MWQAMYAEEATAGADTCSLTRKFVTQQRDPNFSLQALYSLSVVRYTALWNTAFVCCCADWLSQDESKFEVAGKDAMVTRSSSDMATSPGASERRHALARAASSISPRSDASVEQDTI